MKTPKCFKKVHSRNIVVHSLMKKYDNDSNAKDFNTLGLTNLDMGKVRNYFQAWECAVFEPTLTDILIHIIKEKCINKYE